MKTFIFIVYLTIAILIIILLPRGTTVLSYKDKAKEGMVWALGYNWETLTVDEVIGSWNVNHPSNKIKGSDNLRSTIHLITGLYIESKP